MSTPSRPSQLTGRSLRLAVGALVLPVVLAACGAEPLVVEPAQYADVRTDLGADVGLVDASTWLGAEMVGVAVEEGTVNPVASPLSLQLALAMLREGADGEALAQLDAVLGGGDVSAAVAAARQRLDAFDGDVSQVDRDDPPERTLVHVADGIFVQEGAVRPEFVRRVTEGLGAELATVDFAGGTAKPVLDAWVDRETGGLIGAAPLDPSPDVIVALIDAVVFAAQWESHFEPSDTRDEAFTRADGTVVQVPTMHGRASGRYAEGEGWVAGEVPYRDGFAMRVVRHDGAPLDADGWRAVTTALGADDSVSLDVAMPRWESTVTADLREVLVGLGVDAIFEGGLDAIADGAYVEGVAQTATITVAERGTVAAAVTQIDVAQASAVIAEPADHELRLDSPFEYQVYDTSTGLVLFTGLVGDPSAA